jgi:hypothetical protein
MTPKAQLGIGQEEKDTAMNRAVVLRCGRGADCGLILR